jgi:TatD DNase family protein
MLIDTHCHIHESDYPLDTDEVIKRAQKAGVNQIICVGTNTEDSKLALELASKYDGVFASVGVHPHYANDGLGDLESLVDPVYLINDRKLVAIGEIGLDYHYPDDPSPEKQIEILKQQIKLALDHDLPIIFHVRDAYDDFWKALDSMKSDKPIHGVLHSFTDSIENMRIGLKHGFYISINGISTFTHDKLQKQMFNEVPLDRLLLETDAPWLTPYPLRGKIKNNEPAFVREVAQHISQTRHIPIKEIADASTRNARKLFNI